MFEKITTPDSRNGKEVEIVVRANDMCAVCPFCPAAISIWNKLRGSVRKENFFRHVKLKHQDCLTIADLHNESA